MGGGAIRRPTGGAAGAGRAGLGSGAMEPPAPASPPAPPAPSPAPSSPWRLVLAVVLTGAAAGFIGIVMALLLEGFETVFYGVGRGSLPERVAAAPAWRRVAAPALGGLVAGALWWWERATGGVVGVEAVVADASGARARAMGVLRPFADAVVQVLTVGSGNSVGREGAPRLAAGAVAVRIAARLGIDRTWSPLLVASAAGAGLGAMYNAPLGGAAYAVELVMVAGTRRRGIPVAVAVSCLAVTVSWLHSGGRPSLEMGAAPLTWPTAAACLPAAAVAAGLGRLARGGWARARRHRLPDGWGLPPAIGAAGLATGAASLWLAVLPGNGRDAFQAALSSPAVPGAAAALVGVVVLKPLLTGATLGAGATGGLLAPSFSLGASAGAAVAVGLGAAGAPVSVAALALVGAGAALAVTQRAPVFAAVFVWELTRGPVWTLPVLLAACLIAAGPRPGAGRGPRRARS